MIIKQWGVLSKQQDENKISKNISLALLNIALIRLEWQSTILQTEKYTSAKS